MLAGMTAEQLQEWRAYGDLEPFDEERADSRSGHIVQTLINLQRGRGKPRVALEDCVLKFGKPHVVRTTPEEARAGVRAAMQTLMTMQKVAAKAKKRKGR
jgi:predicted trehalose synthase